MAQIHDNTYRAASGAKVFTVDPSARIVEIATRQHGRAERHAIAAEVLVKMIYGPHATVVILPEPKMAEVV